MPSTPSGVEHQQTVALPRGTGPAPVPDVGADDVDPLLGTVIAQRYKLVARIGHGGMGTVYRGEHTTLRKPVAVKFLHPEMARVPEVVSRFEREAVAAAHLEHPNVVAAHDFGKTDDGGFFLAMELVDGRSLRAVLDAEGRLSPARALHITRHIGAAVDRAHALGIVHRDLKPENVMLVERNGDPDFAKVLDFGIAKLTVGALGESGPALTQAGMVFGTPSYMAPEQAMGTAIDHRADLYALGVMTFEMLVGEPPFKADEIMEVIGKLLSSPPPVASARVPPGALQPAVDPVLAQMMAKKPRERFGSAAEFVAALEAALGAAPQPAAVAAQAGAFGGDVVSASGTYNAPLPAATSAPAPSAWTTTVVPWVVTRARAITDKVRAEAPVLARRTVTSAHATYGDVRRDPLLLRAVVIGAALTVLVLGGVFITAIRRSARPHPALTAQPVYRPGGRRAAAPVPGPAPAEQPRPTRTAPERPSAALDPDLAAQLEAYRARPDVAPLLAAANGRQLTLVARALEAAWAHAPTDAAAAYVLGTLHARRRGGLDLAVARYADALRLEPGFARDPTLLRDVARGFALRRPSPGAEALLRGTLEPYAASALLDVMADARSPGRDRLAALLLAPPFDARLDATTRALIQLAQARACAERLVAVETLGREGDARALDALRRVRVGPGCGFFGMEACNPCLVDALPAAIAAIEQRGQGG